MSKQDQSRRFDRRRFLSQVSGGAIGATVGLGLARKSAAAQPPVTAKLERRNEQPGMTYMPFGRTNLNVSRLAFGCIRLVDDRLPALEMAVERGVNVVHVDDGYTGGKAIVSLGKFLKKPGNRDKVWVMLKHLPDDLDAELRILNTDHVDIVCAPITNPNQIRQTEPVLERFEAFKKAGKARLLNLTTHSSVKQCLEAAIDVGCYSTLLAAMDLSTVAELKPTIQRARSENVGVIAMKTRRNARGRGPDEIAKALLGAGVTTILKTLNTHEEVEQWVGGVIKASREAAEGGAERQVAEATGLCTLCGLCDGCPNGVATQDIVRDYTYYYEQQGLCDTAAERYGELRVNQTALSCRDCGRCEKRCPMNVPVRRIIREAHERLTMIG